MDVFRQCTCALVYFFSDSLTADVQNVSRVSKLWFAYLCHPLQSTLSTSRHDYLADQYNLLISRCDRMIHWCQASNANLKALHNVEHLTENLPCGRLHIVNRMSGEIFKRIISVDKMFSINMTFLRFEVLDSGRRCSDSAFKMAEYITPRPWTPGAWHQRDYWIYCGYKPPWSETIQSHKLLIHLNQVELRNHFNISFMYYVIDYKIFINYTKQHIYNTKHGIRHVTFTMQKYQKVGSSWLINFPPGHIVHIKELSMCCVGAEFRIFDGPKKLFKLYTFLNDTKHEVFKRLDMYSNYFEVLIELYVRKFYDDAVHESIKFTYDREMASSKELLLNSKTSIKSNHKILHLVFLLQGEHMEYPNVSFSVRAFEGWNDGGCNLGGFAVVQHHQSNTNASIISGPYCRGGTLNQPLVTKHGLQHLIFSGNRTHLVIYAYGPAYHIDLDVIVSGSKCEGLLDPMLACLIEYQIGEREHAVRRYVASTYKLMCSFSLNNYMLEVEKVVGCVDIQTINHGYAYAYYLEIKMPVVAHLNYITPIYYTFNGFIANLNTLLAIWGNHSSSANNVEGMLSSTRKHFGKVSTLAVKHTIYRKHHPSTLRLKITVFDAPQSLCRVLNKSAHAEVGHNRERQAFMAQLTGSCVTGTYTESTLYFFIIPPKPVERNKYITMLCFDILKVNSDLDMPTGILTVTVRDIITQSLMVSQEKLHVEVVDVSVVLFYEKLDLFLISTFVLEFRRYALPCFTLTIGYLRRPLYLQV